MKSINLKLFGAIFLGSISLVGLLENPAHAETQVITNKDPVTDKENIFVGIESNIKGDWMGTPVLTIGCRNNKTIMYIDWKKFLGLDPHTVTTRVGDKPARDIQWDITNNNTGSWWPKFPGPILKEISAGGSLTARVTPYSDSTTTAKFVIDDKARNGIKRIAKTCGWEQD